MIEKNIKMNIFKNKLICILEELLVFFFCLIGWYSNGQINFGLDILNKIFEGKVLYNYLAGSKLWVVDP